MNDIEQLRTENARLKESLARKDSRLDQAHSQLTQANSQHQAVVAELAESLEEKDRTVRLLERQIEKLLRQIRGSRQERIDPDQLMLFSVEELQQLANELGLQDEQDGSEEDDDSDSTDKGKPKRKGHGRRKLPEHLPREVIRHELDESELPCPCCGELREAFGVESSEQLEFVPAKWKVIQHDRVKYACRLCEEHVILADKPPQPIEKGLPAAGLCAHTTLSKFGDHQPLYRLEDIHARAGFTLRRSTLCGWLTSLAELSRPLVMRMKTLVLESKVIHTDDTKIKMLEPGTGTTRGAKFWPYLGDWLHPYAVCDFTLDRSRDGPKNFLEGFTGYLQADAYSGYDCLYAGKDVLEVACWIHTRRYWYDAQKYHAKEAAVALAYIARLSQIEAELRRAFPKTLVGERDFEAVASARREHSLPILLEMKTWLDGLSENKRVLPKSELRSAITYTQNQWAALCRYVEAGYLSMDNNVAERLVKVAAMGRKNYLFVGNAVGGANAAIHYSLVSSAKMNGVEPFAWLRDVYSQLAEHRGGESFREATEFGSVTSDELDYLLPDKWLERHPRERWEINEIRRKEREQAERRKRRKRLKKKRR